jgi:cell division protein FtsB
MIQRPQNKVSFTRIILEKEMRKILLFCCFWAILGNVSGQDYKAFKQQLQQQTKLYRENVPCEKAVKDKLGKLADLMQLTPDKPEIVRSCKFIRGMSGGCPQTNLKELLLKIQKNYATAANDTVFVANGQDALGIPESEVFDTLDKPEAEKEKTPPYNTYLMYFSLISLSLLCAYLLVTLKRLQKAHLQTHKIINNTPKSQPNTIMNEEILERLNKEIATLREENGRLRSEFTHFKRELNELRELCNGIDSRILSWEKQKKEEVTTSYKPFEEARVIPTIINEVPPAPVVVETPQPVIQPPVNQTTSFIDKKYALYMDNSEGFSAQGLMPFSGSETIYEILLQSERGANYRVFENNDAHQYALTDPSYYLRTACEYENSPAAGKRIETISEGVLENTGSVWKIVRKAKIRFI